METVDVIIPAYRPGKNLRSCWILFPHRIIQWKKFLL